MWCCPFLHGLAETNGDGKTDRQHACLDLYRKFGRLADNEVVREMLGLLSVAGSAAAEDERAAAAGVDSLAAGFGRGGGVGSEVTLGDSSPKPP